MIEELITHRIAALGPDYREFVESDYVPEAAAAFGDAEGLIGRRVEVLENAILLYLLLIFSSEETINFIARNCDMAPSEAASLWVGITSTLPEGMAAAIEFARTSLETGAGTASATPLATEIAEAEQALWSLPHIRTMADDMKASPNPPTEAAVLPEEHVHSSSQVDILPNGNTLPEPRWESEVEK